MQKIKSYKDKVVVVTGAASGIGAAISRSFAREGAKLALLDMDSESVEGFARDLESNGTEAAAFGCNVSNQNNCTRAIGGVLQHFGGIDILINNAGITQRSAFAETSADVFKRVMDVNFFGSLYCTQAALPSLISRRGHIAVIESVGGDSAGAGSQRILRQQTCAAWPVHYLEGRTSYRRRRGDHCLPRFCQNKSSKTRSRG